MGVEIKFTDKDLPVSPGFIEFLHHQIDHQAIDTISGVRIPTSSSRRAIRWRRAFRYTTNPLGCLIQDGKTLELERGESGYASTDRTQLYRLQFTPSFLERDGVLSAPGAGGLFCGFGFGVR